MTKRTLSAAAVLCGGALLLTACGDAPPGEHAHPAAEGARAPDELLEGFLRGGAEGLAQAEREGRPAMLLVSASW